MLLPLPRFARVLITATALAGASCNVDQQPSESRDPGIVEPVFGLNGHGGTVALASNGLIENGASCMGDDAVASGLISGVKSATDLNCTSTDISLTEFRATEYSFDGTTFVPVQPGSPIACDLGETIFLRMNGVLAQKANNSRYDVGIWISFDSPSALSGSCEQYSLTVGAVGPVNLDNDQCGELFPGAFTVVPFDLVQVQCRDDGAGFVNVGSCIGWKQPGSDAVCPTAPSDEGFRYGSLPGGKSKCNCQTVQLPISVNANALGKP